MMEVLAQIPADSRYLERRKDGRRLYYRDMTTQQLMNLAAGQSFEFFGELTWTANKSWAEEELARRRNNQQAQQQDADLELREEVIEALVAEGKARHVAANLTNSSQKLMAEARRLAII